MNPVIFWGATGQARVLREALPEKQTLVALFDNRDIASPFPDIPIFVGEKRFLEWIEANEISEPISACVTIGGQRGSDRLSILRYLETHGCESLNVIHRRSFIADTASIGRGNQILALSAVCAGAKLGDAVIVNTAASIDHDCIVGDGVHIAPGARLTGEVVVRDFAFIGAGAVVLPRIRIGEHSVVGAGSIVTRDVPDGMTVAGNPARSHK